MKPLLFALLSIILIVSCKQDINTSTQSATNRDIIPDHDANQVRTEAEVIALKNGLLEWEKVRQIDFTFNVDRGGKTVAQRSWQWQPKTDNVRMISSTDTITYNRKTIDSTHIATDRGFINDKYWLLVPYQLVWDEGTTITLLDTATAPISKKQTKKLTIVYNDKGGYTPGDAYDLYYDNDFIIDEWVFRKANAASASMTTSFEDYENYAGLHIAKTHKAMGSDVNIYFTDIKVQ
jgi:hypothetical protein